MNQTRPIETIILDTPGSFGFSKQHLYEPTPNFFSPIYIDIKKLVSDPETRKIITLSLEKLLKETDVDCICGLESGGSYFASAVADQMGLPLFFLRKESKSYGDFRKIIGIPPKTDSKIVIIDDVLAKGLTLSKSLKYLRSINYLHTSFISIYSYGIDQFLSNELKIDIKSLSNFENLLKIAQEKQILNLNDMEYLRQHVSHFTEIFKQSQINAS